MLSYCALLDGGQLSSVEASSWTGAQPPKDAGRSVTGTQPTVKSTAGSHVAAKRKISEDDDDDDEDDDASDSEKMVICEDESAGNEMFVDSYASQCCFSV